MIDKQWKHEYNKKYNKSYRNRGKYNKKFLESLKNNICAFCNKTNTKFQFHHFDPHGLIDPKNIKRFCMADRMKFAALDTLIKESQKCVLLCTKCHRSEHMGKGIKKCSQ